MNEKIEELYTKDFEELYTKALMEFALTGVLSVKETYLQDTSNKKLIIDLWPDPPWM